MKIRQVTHLNSHTLLYFLVLSIFITSVASYYRFIIRSDFIVEYESICDPTTERCFVKCGDNGCAEKHYYFNVRKYAPELYSECGNDITGCKSATTCLSDDHGCLITYCDLRISGNNCSSLVNEAMTQGDVDTNKI